MQFRSHMFARQSWLTKKHNKKTSSDSLGKHAFSNRIFIKLYIRKQKSRKHWHGWASLLPLGLVQNLLKWVCWPSCQVGSPNSHMKATASLAAEGTLWFPWLLHGRKKTTRQSSAADVGSTHRLWATVSNSCTWQSWRSWKKSIME